MTDVVRSVGVVRVGGAANVGGTTHRDSGVVGGYCGKVSGW